MQFQSFRSPPRPFLLAFHVALPLAALALVRWWQYDWSMRNVFRVVLFGEAATLCVWSGLSTQSWPRRIIGLLAGSLAYFAVLRMVDQREPLFNLVECLLIPGAATFALTVAIKSSPSLADENYAGLWQFSVGQLLIIMTMVPIGIVLVREFWQSHIVVSPRLIASEGAQLSVLLMAWAALFRRWRRVRIATAAIVVLAVGIIVQSFMSEGWFFDALRNLTRTPLFRIWEDLVSIPLATLIESLLAAATVRALYVSKTATPAAAA